MATSQSGTRGAATQEDPTKGRWWLVAAALLLQFAIGAVYAWSVFGKALQAAPPFKLTKLESSLPFEVTIGMIFIGTYIGGRIQDRRGPRVVAMAGGVIYGLGVMMAAFATSRDQLPLLVAGYGVISGFGLGLAYIVPIAMLQKWFPDKRGLITGLAVGGFGFGAVLTSPVAQSLIDSNKDVPTKAFLPLGIAYLVLSVIGASFFRNPPEGYAVPGWDPAASGRVVDSGRDYTQAEALRTPQWYLLTAILTLNVTAGIALISQAAASAADIAGYTATAAAARSRGAGGLQRRRTDHLGSAVRLHRADAGLRGDARPVGSEPVAPAARNERRTLLHPRRRHLPVLRRRVRHDAGNSWRLLRRQARRCDLRSDDHRVEYWRRHRASHRLRPDWRHEELHARLHDLGGHRAGGHRPDVCHQGPSHAIQRTGGCSGPGLGYALTVSEGTC